MTRTTNSAGGRYPRRWATNALGGIALGTGLAAFIVFGLLRPVYVINAPVRSAIETVIAISALAGAALLWRRFWRTRLLADLMLLVALATVSLVDLAGWVLPSLLGRQLVPVDDWIHLLVQALVAGAFAAAAFVSDRPRRVRGSRSTATAVWIGVPVMAVVAGLGVLTDSKLASMDAPAAGLDSAIDHPLALAVHLATFGALLAAAFAFQRRRDLDRHERAVLSASVVLIAAAQIQTVVLARPDARWITVGLGLRTIAYVMLLGVAMRQYARNLHEDAQAALQAERERIARDLHDGLAQDLALIAAHSDRLTSALGSDHPVVIAVRRALALSRGKMADLAASSAPTTEAALRTIASELEWRYQIVIDVHTHDPLGDELSREDREEVVRIAREAIVNAVKHGNARHLRVELGSKARAVLLRVCDDGTGIDEATPDTAGSGLGLPAMRARAAAVGGRLVASQRNDGGGTTVEVLTS